MKIFKVIGLGYGDEGKGTIVDYLVRKYSAEIVIRSNGGGQAAHNVHTTDGLHHTFASFGSGTLVPGVKTFLSQYFVVDPVAINNEAEALKQKGINDASQRLLIDDSCLVVTPAHKILNRMSEESRGDKRNGSCGMGVGQTIEHVYTYGYENSLIAKDLLDPQALEDKLGLIWAFLIIKARQLFHNSKNKAVLQTYLDELLKPGYIEDTLEYYKKFGQDFASQIIDQKSIKPQMQKQETIVFEGAQGVLLDVEYGFWPHVTKSKTTFENANFLISIFDLHGEEINIGVTRAYQTRHGRGPFVSEDKELTKFMSTQPEDNQTNLWQEHFKYGWLDLVGLQYAVDMVPELDCIALTNIDKVQKLLDSKKVHSADLQLCDGYICDNELSKKVTTEMGIVCHENDLTRISKLEYIRSIFHSDQVSLSRLLGKCKPYNIAVRDINALISILEKRLGRPIAITSFGPTAEDKIARLPLIKLKE